MSFLRNSTANFLGGLLPAVALFVTIPLIVHRMGAEAYGALVLITSIVGYFGIMDINATAGTVKYVAEHQARGESDEVGRVVSFGLLIYFAIGAAGGLALFFGAGHLVNQVFKIDPSWRTDAYCALQVASLAFFFGQIQVFLQSIPQALGRYDLSGRFDALFGSLAPLLTIAVVWGGGGLTAIVAARLVLSTAHCAALLVLLRRLLPLIRLRRPDRLTSRKVASFSLFTYLQRLASVTSNNADKLLIGAQQSMLALATYVIPFTLAGRMFALLNRFVHGMFPLTSHLDARADHPALRSTFIYVSRYMAFLNIALCLLLALFSRELLTYWLRQPAEPVAVLVLIIVAYMMLVESLTNAPSLVNDGLGRPHITGVAALLRVAFGVSAAWMALRLGGIVELAVSQLVVGAVFTAAFLWVVHRHSLPWRLGSVVGAIYGVNAVVLLAGTALVAWRWGDPLMGRWAFAGALAGAIVLLAGVGWLYILFPAHRVRLRDLAAARLPRIASL